MADPGIVENRRGFSLVFFFVSLVFFSLYLYIFAASFSGLTPRFFHISVPEWNLFYSFNGGFFFAILMIAPFIAGFFLVRKLQETGLLWQAGMPLCFLLGMISVSLIILTFYDPSRQELKILSLAFTTELMGYALLPAATFYFFRYWNILLPGTISPMLMSVSAGIAGIGGFFFVYLLWGIITYVPPETTRTYDVFQFAPEGLIALVGALFYAALMLPFIGLVFIWLGRACWNPPPRGEGTQETPS